MARTPEYLSFQSALRIFLKEAFGSTEASRDFALTETLRGMEKLCFGLCCIDSGFRENTVEFSFRQMSRELYGFLSGPVSEAVQKHYAEDRFWLIYREPACREQKGIVEQVTASEVTERFGPMCLLIFNKGHDWAYVNEVSSTVYLSAKVARKVRA